MRQDFETLLEWHSSCCALFEDWERTVPEARAISCVAWLSDKRPIYSDKDLYEEHTHKGCRWRDLISVLKTFPNPLWGWMALAMKWFMIPATMKLFHILMACGCDRPKY